MDKLEIRPATPADIPTILELIGELAAYEHMLDRVQIDEARLRKYVFSEKACAEVLLACLEGEAVAYALFFPHFASFRGLPKLYLEDIYVRQQARGRGVGRALMASLASIAIERGWAGMAWSVLDWNESAFAFYAGLGATKGNGHVAMELSGKALESLAG